MRTGKRPLRRPDTAVLFIRLQPSDKRRLDERARGLRMSTAAWSRGVLMEALVRAV